MPNNNPHRLKLQREITTFKSWAFPEVTGSGHIARLQRSIGNVLLSHGQLRHEVAGLVRPTGCPYWEATAVVVGDSKLTGEDEDENVVIVVQFGREEFPIPNSTIIDWVSRAVVTIGYATEPYIDTVDLTNRSLRWPPGFMLETRLGTYAQSENPFRQIRDAILAGTLSSFRRGPTGDMLPGDIEHHLEQMVRMLDTCPIHVDNTAKFAGKAALAVRNDHLEVIL